MLKEVNTLDLYYLVTQFFLLNCSPLVYQGIAPLPLIYFLGKHNDESDNYFALKIENGSLILICDFVVYFFSW